MNPDVSGSFFKTVGSFEQFEELTDSQCYSELPDNWSVVVADIKNSTQLVSEGRYKDVNLLGATTIAACNKILGDTEFPFCFGGDGASLCLPPSFVTTAQTELGRLKKIAKDNFGINLRVACMPYAVLKKDNKPILVGCYEMTQGLKSYVFKGGGLAHADFLAKNSGDLYEVDINEENSPSVEQISCRWQPIPSQRGQVVSLIVMANQEPSEAIYSDVLNYLESNIQGGLEAANPVKSTQMSYNSFGEMWKQESRLHGNRWNSLFLKRVFEFVFCTLLIRWKLPIFQKSLEAYCDSIPAHSDYKKFDDALRLIIDCTQGEADLLEEFLSEKHKTGQLVYGIHRSSHALLTCMVKNLGQGGHMHFVDGSDGGYTSAAKGLKKQLAARKAS